MIPTPHEIVQDDENQNRWYVLDSKYNIIAIAVDETQAVNWASKMLSKNKAKNADLDALERACEIALDGNTLKAVIEAKRRIKEGGAK